MKGKEKTNSESHWGCHGKLPWGGHNKQPRRNETAGGGTDTVTKNHGVDPWNRKREAVIKHGNNEKMGLERGKKIRKKKQESVQNEGRRKAVGKEVGRRKNTFKTKRVWKKGNGAH